MKKIGILGSTGSIGTQGLDIVRENPDLFKVTALACNENIELLQKQITEFSPEAVCVFNEARAMELSRNLPRQEILAGYQGLCDIAGAVDYDLLLNGVMGMIGLEPTYRAIDSGKDVALANKETLVAAGEIIMNAARYKGVNIYPVDSEHSAIFQCLAGEKKESVKNVIITASGGPFLGMKKKQLDNVTASDALKHPNWSMGKKITIDSATLMNKGLEVIEAKWLFDLEPDRIKVVVHPQSIIHSMVEFKDNAVLAQMGVPDMKVPISLGLSGYSRIENKSDSLDLVKIGELTFLQPDMDTFPCLQYAFDALKIGGTATCTLNSANEVLVSKFLKGEIKFLDIPKGIEKIMSESEFIKNPSLEEILELDKEIRGRILKC